MWPVELKRFNDLSSTNTIAIDLAKFGAVTGTVVVAKRQSGGRGRMGRHWESQEGGLWFSIVFQNTRVDEFHFFTIVAALAVSEVLTDLTSENIDIHWPNDLVYQGHKLCGILAETLQTDNGDAAVVMGIGLNVNNDVDQLKSSLERDITSVQAIAGKPIELDDLLTQLLERLYYYYEEHRQDRREDILAKVAQHNCLLGKAVNVQFANESIDGVCKRIHNDGGLVLDVDGNERIVYAGDVSRLQES